jgi:hypothetical protein
MTDDEIGALIAEKQAENLPDTTLVIFTRVPIQAALTPAEREGAKAQIDVIVSREDAGLHAIDDLLGYFHDLVDAHPRVQVSFKIVGGDTFSAKLEELYDKPPTEEEIAAFVETQRDAIDNLGRFNAAVKLMRDTGEYDPQATEQEVLDWYARVEAAVKAGGKRGDGRGA